MNIEQLRKNVSPRLIQAIRDLVDYSWDAERKDYEDSSIDDEDAVGNSRTNHIFLRLKALDAWLDSGESCASAPSVETKPFYTSSEDCNCVGCDLCGTHCLPGCVGGKGIACTARPK